MKKVTINVPDDCEVVFFSTAYKPDNGFIYLDKIDFGIGTEDFPYKLWDCFCYYYFCMYYMDN